MDGRTRPGRERPSEATPGLIVYVTEGHSACGRLEEVLVATRVPYVGRDVVAEARAMAEVAERTRGRARLPAVRIGDLLLESQTPVSLSRFLRSHRR